MPVKMGGVNGLLRMEDLDAPRCIPETSRIIQSQLLACGLTWDEDISYQSQRNKAYQGALERLNGLECLYPCTCSRQTIANALAKLGIDTPRNQEMIYPGTCRPKRLTNYSMDHFSGTKQAWRLALPHDCQIEFMDLALGLQSQNLKEVGDFVLLRRDHLFTYQLAVVVDDAEQGITHIVRGQDLLSNTARQIYLQNLLGYQTPQYRHLPLVLDEHGEKLSKQTLATQIQTQDKHHALEELRKAAKHLGLSELPGGENITIAEWLLSAHSCLEKLKNYFFLKPPNRAPTAGFAGVIPTFFSSVFAASAVEADSAPGS